MLLSRFLLLRSAPSAARPICAIRISGVKMSANKAFSLLPPFAAAAILIALAVTTSMCTSGPDGPSDPGGWADLAVFKQMLTDYGVPITFLASTQAIDTADDPANALMVIVGVESEFDSEDFTAINAFASAGGTVLIADDGNLANRVSTAFGVEYDGAPVIVMKGYEYNVSFIYTNATIDGYEYIVLFNGPTGLIKSNNATVIARSPEQVSVCDRNHNYVLEVSEYTPWVPFAVQVTCGEGSILFFSNTGLFTDKMVEYNKYENKAFINKMISTFVPEGGHIYIDQSKQVSEFSGHIILPGT